MYNSYTYGKLELHEIPDKMLEYYNKNKDNPISIIIGTDSQNFSDTKMVSVIAICCEGKGGIFFYEVTHLKRIMDIRQKLHTETQYSLEIANDLLKLLEEEKYNDLYLNCSFSIHVDAGTTQKSKTSTLIPEITGWVKAYGYECEVKPDSFVASSIANKISK